MIELKVGRTYRAKKPAVAGNGYYNDRQIIHISMFEVQYDGPAVTDGRHYPSIPKDKFLAWAGKDVSDTLPDGDWARWDK